jgi:hypothetical protein
MAGALFGWMVGAEEEEAEEAGVDGQDSGVPRPDRRRTWQAQSPDEGGGAGSLLQELEPEFHSAAVGHAITKDWLPRCEGRTPHEASPKRESRRGAALGDTRQTFFRVRSFPSHFHSRRSLRAIPWFSGVSLHVVESREKPRKTLNLRVVAPTGFAPVFQARPRFRHVTQRVKKHSPSKKTTGLKHAARTDPAPREATGVDVGSGGNRGRQARLPPLQLVIRCPFWPPGQLR